MAPEPTQSGSSDSSVTLCFSLYPTPTRPPSTPHFFWHAHASSRPARKAQRADPLYAIPQSKKRGKRKRALRRSHVRGRGVPGDGRVGAAGAQGHHAHPRPLPPGRQGRPLPRVGLPNPRLHQPRRLHLPLHVPPRAAGHLLRLGAPRLAGPQRAHQALRRAVPPGLVRAARDLRLPRVAVQPRAVHLLLRHLPLALRAPAVAGEPRHGRLLMASRVPHHALQGVSRLPHRPAGFRGSSSRPCIWCYLVLVRQHHSCSILPND
ncbi:hypothetical protein ACQJBY_017244 [Aegilops geniculata]